MYVLSTKVKSISVLGVSSLIENVHLIIKIIVLSVSFHVEISFILFISYFILSSFFHVQFSYVIKICFQGSPESVATFDLF